MGRRFSSRFFLPDAAPLVLNEEEKKKVQSFDLEILKVQKEKIEYLRSLAREKDITAACLKDLKSESGSPFIELQRERKGYEYREAKSSDKTEVAYLCCGMYIKEDKDSCGWVKGRPKEQEYDEIGVIAGSAGIRYYCKICGKEIGELQIVLS